MASSGRRYSPQYYYHFVDQHRQLPLALDRKACDANLIKSLLPVDRFLHEIRAAKENDSTLAAIDETELLIVKLLHFFKNDFFRWVDAIDCEKCGDNNTCLFNTQRAQLFAEELANEASNVEIYRCNTCGTFSRFPRYNNPVRLLQTRRGRCGEWANCFAYILYSLGVRTRLVYCTTDHVWIEFYNGTEDRWMHADPCEDEYDNPLMYQLGWGKTIDLVLARGEHELRDVTWRYTAKWKDTAQDRRSKFSEAILLNMLEHSNASIQWPLSSAERLRLEQHLIAELTTFVKIPGQESLASDKTIEGRKSGSAAWRLSRAEIGNASSARTCAPSEAYCFQLKPLSSAADTITTSKDDEQQLISVKYDCAQDLYRLQYSIPADSGNDFREMRGWSAGVSSMTNIFRNIELDWKMCYLSRMKRSMSNDIGEICWRFAEQANAEKHWSRVEIEIRGETFHSGKAQLTFLFANQQIDFELNRPFCVRRSDFVAQVPNDEKQTEEKISSLGDEPVESQTSPLNSFFEIRARLSGGDGDCAWQHAQLFRQSSKPNSTGFETFPFTIFIFYQE